MMTEGTVPVSPYRPWAYKDDDVVPVRELTYVKGATTEGVKLLLSVQLGIEHFCGATFFIIISQRELF